MLTRPNSIGELGSGPNEYIELSDFSISPENKAIIVCRQTKSIYQYNLNGQLISKQEMRLPISQGLINKDKSMWIYLGYANVVNRGRVAKIDLDGNLIFDTLESKFNVMIMDEITPVFSSFDNNIFIRESFNNIIYIIEDGVIAPLYKFDFGKYNIPDEYWGKSNYEESMNLLMSLDFVVVRRYMENSHYSLLEAQIQQNKNPKLQIVHGVQNKNNKKWRWYNSDVSEQANPVLIKSIQRLTDNNEMLSIASPDLIKQYSSCSKITNPEIINQIKDDDNYLIIKCRLK